ncbi:MAG: phosphatase PAP2 family protein [Patescibacteria group bacterium]
MRRFFSLVNKTPLTRMLFIEISAGLIVNIAVLLLFLFLTQDVLEKETRSFDLAASNFIYALRTPALTVIMSTVTNLAAIPSGFALSLLVVLLLLKHHKKESLVFSLALVFGGALNYYLKIFFKLPRPDLSPLVVLGDFTYPSGHAMNNLVLYGLLTYYAFHFTKSKALSMVAGGLASGWILLIGLSRVYLGAHYPSDVLAGYLAGFWWLLTVLLIDKTISLSKEARKFHE